jgi:hypothetical protein
MVSERFSRSLGVLLVSSMLLPSLALAQGTQATKEAKETARQLMAEGREARDDKKDLKAALEAFRKAHSIMKVPTTGLEVARTLEAMGHFIEAAEAAQEVLDIPPPPKGKEPEAFVRAREDAQKLLEESKKKIGYIKIAIKGAKPDAVEVTINDLTVAPTALKDPIPQNPGKHNVVAKGPKTSSVEIDLAPGATEEVTLDVTKPEKKKVVEEAPPPPPPPPEEKSAFLRPMPLVGFGLAGVGLLAGSITGAMTLSRASTIKEGCEGDRCPRSKSADIDSAKTLGLVSTISFAVAGVGATIGVVGLLMKPEKPKEEAGKVRVTPWLGLGSAGVVGQFLTASRTSRPGRSGSRWTRTGRGALGGGRLGDRRCGGRPGRGLGSRCRRRRFGGSLGRAHGRRLARGRDRSAARRHPGRRPHRGRRDAHPGGGHRLDALGFEEEVLVAGGRQDGIHPSGRRGLVVEAGSLDEERADAVLVGRDGGRVDVVRRELEVSGLPAEHAPQDRDDRGGGPGEGGPGRRPLAHAQGGDDLLGTAHHHGARAPLQLQEAQHRRQRDQGEVPGERGGGRGRRGRRPEGHVPGGDDPRQPGAGAQALVHRQDRQELEAELVGPERLGQADVSAGAESLHAGEGVIGVSEKQERDARVGARGLAELRDQPGGIIRERRVRDERVGVGLQDSEGLLRGRGEEHLQIGVAEHRADQVGDPLVARREDHAALGHGGAAYHGHPGERTAFPASPLDGPPRPRESMQPWRPRSKG